MSVLLRRLYRPDSLVTAGRVVRCARCGGDWTPVAAAAAPEPEAPEPARRHRRRSSLRRPRRPGDERCGGAVATTARPSAMERLAAHAAWPQPSTRLRLAWAASLVLLVLAAGAAYAWRDQIVAEWPPSAHAYALFGLQPQTETSR